MLIASAGVSRTGADQWMFGSCGQDTRHTETAHHSPTPLRMVTSELGLQEALPKP